MDVAADADVPLLHASFTCAESTAADMAKDLRRQALRSPRTWTVEAVTLVFLGLAVSLNIRAPGHHDGTAYLLSYPLVLFMTLLAAAPLAGVCKISRTTHAFSVEHPPGAVLRSEFGTHGFTVRTPRGALSYRYTELLPILVSEHVVVVRLRHQPQQSIVRPRELFPEPALALIRPHTEVRRRG